MAASLAVSHCLDDPDRWNGWMFDSAGILAGSGSPATPEARQAAGRHGGSLDHHASKPLTAEMIESSHTVYCLTQDHLRMARALAPAESDKILLLDPEGHDVPDPIGGPQEVYDQTADALDRMIRARLEEIAA
jgi:protein-tyrosine phosphatase